MATISQGMAWFKQNFGDTVAAGVTGTPFSADLLAAIAVQETFEVWGSLIETMPADEILKICVGDTLDAPNRSAFPKTKAELLGAANGQQMFDVARGALEALAPHNAAYAAVARNPDKFCHGFGIFQYDIQFFRTDPDFFLQRQWFDFAHCLDKALVELAAAKSRAYGAQKAALTDREMVFVAIAYNRGSVDVNGDFRQGFKQGDGEFYGQMIARYLGTAEQVAVA